MPEQPQANDIREALYAVAREDALADQTECCQHCGAKLDVHLLDVSTQYGVPVFARGITLGCPAQCWKLDPRAFLASLGVQP